MPVLEALSTKRTSSRRLQCHAGGTPGVPAQRRRSRGAPMGTWMCKAVFIRHNATRLTCKRGLSFCTPPDMMCSKHAVSAAVK